MSSSLNASLERLQKAERVAQAEVRVFRSNEHPGLCHEMVDGHRAVLMAYGIKNLTTFNRDWIGRSDVLAILAQGADGRILGGARMQRIHDLSDMPLFRAVSEQDPELARVLQPYIDEGAWELGGLWNSMELAGMGVEATFLIQAAMAAMPLSDARHMFALTSPVTRRMQTALGFETQGGVGDDGFFIYPTPTLKASIARFTFPEQLTLATAEVREFLKGIWEDPMTFAHEMGGPKGEMLVRFRLEFA
jgi:hypothetical protein